MPKPPRTSAAPSVAPARGLSTMIRKRSRATGLFALALALTTGCATATKSHAHDVLLRGGLVYDGSGGPPFVADVAIDGDTITAIGRPGGRLRGEREIDVHGLAVAPGFINMLSHAEETLVADGRGQSDIRQGVTLEVFGESSMGPLSPAMKQEWKSLQADLKYDIEWTTLGEYLALLEQRGISPNVASFVGAGNAREVVLGKATRAPSAEELEQMRGLVRQGMEDGALGLTTALMYVPMSYATTEELVALASVAAEYGGTFTAHIRDEGNREIEAIDEMVRIAREARVPVEIYHLKLAGRQNWGRLDEVVSRVEKARAEGLRLTADMYTYAAAMTGLDASMPPWVQEGTVQDWIARLKNPAVRERVRREMLAPGKDWDNAYYGAGPENILLMGFKNPALRPLMGQRLAEVAAMRGISPEETAMDLVIEDGTRVTVAYFEMAEDNVRRQAALPWVSFGSDAEALAPAGVFLTWNPHPRAYGNFARLLGKYVREENVIPLEEAIRRLTSQPSDNLGLSRRGRIAAGHFADIAVFDPARIADHATFENPHQYATGMVHVFVNGVQVLKDGEHTGAKPGRIVRGSGWKGRR
jgi:N-acyl-D-amino-acid deacylase